MSSTAQRTGGTGTTAPRRSRGVAVVGLLLIIFGAIMAVAGVVTWVAVGNELAAEKITVSEDAARFAGQPVDTPWEAYTEAEDDPDARDGDERWQDLRRAGREDPKRQTVMTASFLRASLLPPSSPSVWRSWPQPSVSARPQAGQCGASPLRPRSPAGRRPPACRRPAGSRPSLPPAGR